MARYEDITFGTTHCRVLVRTFTHAAAEVTVFVGNEEVSEGGQRVERFASTDGQAIEAMCSYLEQRYGPRQ